MRERPATFECPRALWMLLAALVASAPASAQNESAASVRLAALEERVGGPVQATWSGSTGLVTFVTFAPQRRARVEVGASAPAEERARAFLEEYGELFGVVGSELSTLSRDAGADGVGMEHVRFRQTHRGVPVTGGEIAVHLLGAEVVAINAKTVGDLGSLDPTPQVGPEAAEAVVREFLHRRLGRAQEELSVPRLELLNRGLLDGRAAPTHLAWFIEAAATDLREWVWVDARTGAAVLHFSQLTDTRDRRIHDADDPGDGVYANLPGDLARSEGDLATGDADTDAAYDYTGDTYDYFAGEHGRDSYDDAGAMLVSSVHYCPNAGSCPYANAFWNGTQMVFGEGFPAADDVAAHELTHAVTEHTAGLFYYMQSGALNESYSDVFGEVVDLANGSGTDTPGVRWLMGEDVPGFGAIRDMMDPTTFGDPGKTSDAQFVCGDPGTDNGGVHSNSGVPNHAFALAVDGGAYNGEVVSGIGEIKAGKVWYRALAHYLLSASDFRDNYDALIQSCADLTGGGSLTAADCGEVEKALDAVEMASPWPCVPVQAEAPELCTSGESPTLWHSFDFGASSGLADCPAAALPVTWCLNGPSSLLGSFATSGEHSGWAYNRPEVSSQELLIMPSGNLPAGARMQFNHSHGFENTAATYWDGGVVEYTVDGGASWLDGGPLITAGDAYGGVISGCCSNPLAGRNAFGGDSWGYTATQLDLSAFSGSTFGYRFTVGTDSIFDDYGWFVDDVRIYSCSACEPVRELTGDYSGLAGAWSASVRLGAGDGFAVLPNQQVRLTAPVVVIEGNFAGRGEIIITNDGCP